MKGSAALEVANLGMEKAQELRHHLMKQFGGAGEDLRARQEVFETGMPKSPGAAAFPESVDMPEKLRELEAERCALFKFCQQKKNVHFNLHLECS